VFYLINVCNIKFPMCLRAEDLIEEYPELKLSKEKLTLEDMQRVLDEGYRHGLPSVNFGGSGECTLHPDFLDMTRMVMERDVMELRIITNGLRLTRDVAEALVDTQVHVVSVSIDAFSAETYGKIRGKPQQYDLLMQNVMALLELRRKRRSVFPLLRVSFVRQPDNKEETKAFLEHWTNLADMVEVQIHHDFRATSFSRDFDCSEPFRRLNVWASRKVGPCCGFPGIVFDVGTIGRQTLAEIWRGEPITEIRRQLLDRDYAPACLRCQGTRTPYSD
jgi:wyosine [tRNA(Phe)-imidazoG37] synthetase (radical SAM superfamily)